VSNYVRSVPFKTLFDGDEVTARIRPVSRADVLSMTPKMTAEGLNIMTSADAVAGLLPKYVDEFAGLKDAAGAAVTLETVCEDAYFSQLVVEIGTALVKTGQIPKSTPSAEP
jgi:hypothetical protein